MKALMDQETDKDEEDASQEQSEKVSIQLSEDSCKDEEEEIENTQSYKTMQAPLEVLQALHEIPEEVKKVINILGKTSAKRTEEDIKAMWRHISNFDFILEDKKYTENMN